MGLEADPVDNPANQSGAAPAFEPAFSRAQAMRTVGFWMLMLYTVMVYPVQAGVSLHQASHLVQRGLDPVTAALVVSVSR